MKIFAIASICFACIASTTTTVSARPVLLAPPKEIFSSKQQQPPQDDSSSLRIRTPNASASVGAPDFSFEQVSDENKERSNIHVPEVLAPFLHHFDPKEPLTQTEAKFLDATIRDAFYKIHQDRGMGTNLAETTTATAYIREKTADRRPLLRGGHKSPQMLPTEREVFEKFKEHKDWISF